MKCLKSILLIALFFSFNILMAQKHKFNLNHSFQDVSFNAGIYNNTGNEYLKDGTNLKFDYGVFNTFGCGFRTGVEYIYDLDEDLSCVGVPLRIAWRTGRDRRKPSERIASAINSYIVNQDPNPAVIILPLLSFRLELDAGLTPGYLFGNPSYGKCYSSLIGEYEEGLIIKNRFSLTGDLGFRIMLRIWRINFMFNPEYHYLLTDNYDFKTTVANRDNPISKSFISINLGAGFLF